MAFNFDSVDNCKSTSVPSAKAINKQFCGSRNAAGIWIADENMSICDWKRSCSSSCEPDCADHYVGTKKHTVSAANDDIPGNGIVSPRMLIVRRSPMIKLTSDKSQYVGPWVKGDGEILNDKGTKKYSFARRYLIIFVDEKNEPLHEGVVQLTAKGNFAFHFDKAYMQFRDEIRTAYAKSMKRRCGSMNELWYAMCVFCPVFESKMVGKPPLTSQACVVKSFFSPNETNWEMVCVGRNMRLNEIVVMEFNNSEAWNKKYTSAPQSFVADRSPAYSEMGDFD
ncbi:hypothetical protein AV955_gp035 [Diadromus pulchellus ascovirus 4a]|uniref:Complete DpAV4 genome n=1 Tax=Diadromus pulchellus ascovirus 4a TaxID=158683 RepID=F2NYW4_9VIRU|nr:hypothetical protein AV955_gp035 [Diadromus pulchellus ascovirus 4a]CCA61392.1 unnamed protein product [Diadromus pulchellus ascovirus 4a]